MKCPWCSNDTTTTRGRTAYGFKEYLCTNCNKKFADYLDNVPTDNFLVFDKQEAF